MSPDSKRADAARNAARLLAAAREVLAESGNDAPYDAIARRAGIGNATLYRHFPTRADLLAAVYADEVATLCRRGADLLAAADPVDALFTWLDDFVVHVATKRPWPWPPPTPPATSSASGTPRSPRPPPACWTAPDRPCAPT